MTMLIFCSFKSSRLSFIPILVAIAGCHCHLFSCASVSIVQPHSDQRGEQLHLLCFSFTSFISPEPITRCGFPSGWMKGEGWIRWAALTSSFSAEVWTSGGLKGRYNCHIKYFPIKFCIKDFQGQKREFHMSGSPQWIWDIK